MESATAPTWTAFAGHARLASGEVPVVVRAVKERLEAEPQAAVAVFDDATGSPVDLDLRGSLAEALARLRPLVPASGRPPRRP